MVQDLPPGVCNRMEAPRPLCVWCCRQEYDQETKDYEVARHAVFWSDDGSKTLYKNHVK